MSDKPDSGAVRTDEGLPSPRVAFVTNFCPHYRVGAFEALARRVALTVYLYSDASEPYWEKNTPVGGGDFSSRTLPGVSLLPRLRVSPALVRTLLRSDYDVLVKCTNGRFALPASFLAARLLRKPFVLWQTMWHHPETRVHRLSLHFLRHVWKKADAIVVYGEHAKRYLVSENVDVQKIFVARQAVDNARSGADVPEARKEALRRELHVGCRNVILYVGRLVPEKGVDHLLSAFAQLARADVALVLAGKGPAEPVLRQMCEGQPNVIFAGHVPPDLLPAYYAIASVSVLPSITTRAWKEPWGLVVNEAMNQACPVVATDAVGAAAGGLLEHGVNGFVVPERNAQALARALAQILDDTNLRQRMSRAAARKVQGWTFDEWAGGFVAAARFARGESSGNPRDAHSSVA